MNNQKPVENPNSRADRFVWKPEDITPVNADSVRPFQESDGFTQLPLPGETMAETEAALAGLEVAQWENKVRNKGAVKGAHFEYMYIPDEVAGYVRSLLLEPGAKPGDVFTTAKDLIALAIEVKSYADTRAGYKGSLYTAIAAAQADETTRRAFAATMRTINRRFGLTTAFDALEAAGVKVESLDTDQLAAFRAWEAQTSEYITAFGAEIFQQGITEDDVKTRAELWANKSLDDLYYKFLALAAPDKRYRWRLGHTQEHCATCQGNHGKVMTMKEWQAAGLPRSEALECGGWLCQCQLEEVTECPPIAPPMIVY